MRLHLKPQRLYAHRMLGWKSQYLIMSNGKIRNGGKKYYVRHSLFPESFRLRLLDARIKLVDYVLSLISLHRGYWSIKTWYSFFVCCCIFL